MSNPMETDVTEVLSEETTLISALIDGEAALTPDCLKHHANAPHQYYYYQLIRQTLRGGVMTSGSHETVAWNQTRFTRLWARVDATSYGELA